MSICHRNTIRMYTESNISQFNFVSNEFAKHLTRFPFHLIFLAANIWNNVIHDVK